MVVLLGKLVPALSQGKSELRSEHNLLWAGFTVFERATFLSFTLCRGLLGTRLLASDLVSLRFPPALIGDFGIVILTEHVGSGGSESLRVAGILCASSSKSLSSAGIRFRLDRSVLSMVSSPELSSSKVREALRLAPLLVVETESLSNAGVRPPETV